MGKASQNLLIPTPHIEGLIYVIRGQRVILDQDLAVLYGVETKTFNRAFYRNQARFPEDFAIHLTKNEWVNLKYQFGTSSSGWGGRRKLPFAFTEHGVVMAANLLKSERAITISVEIVRTFIQMRKMLASSEKFDKELLELKSFVLRHAQKSNQEFRKVWHAIEKLSNPPSQNERRIGFELNQ